MAINLYLAKSRGGPLSPRSLEEEAEMIQWSFWAVAEVERDLLMAMLNRSVFRASDRNIEEESRAIRNLERPFGVLDRLLRSRDWLAGDRFTAADLNVASIASLARLGDLDLGSTPHLKN